MCCRLAGSSTTQAHACLCVHKLSFTTGTHSNWSPTPMPSTSMAQSVWPSVPVSPHTCCFILTYSFRFNKSAVLLTSIRIFVRCFFHSINLLVITPWTFLTFLFVLYFFLNHVVIWQTFLPLFSKLCGGWHLMCKQLPI